MMDKRRVVGVLGGEEAGENEGELEWRRWRRRGRGEEMKRRGGGGENGGEEVERMEERNLWRREVDTILNFDGGKVSMVRLLFFFELFIKNLKAEKIMFPF
jgi:hypothetical protein